MTPRLRIPRENGRSLWPTHSEEGRSVPGAERIRRISFLSSFNLNLFWTTQTFTSEMQDSMVRARVNVSDRESDLYSAVSSANMWWETDGDWLHQKEAEYTKWKELVPGQSPGESYKSEAKERILLHLLLLLVSYLAGKNRRRIKQDHKYQKCFRVDSVEGSA